MTARRFFAFSSLLLSLCLISACNILSGVEETPVHPRTRAHSTSKEEFRIRNNVTAFARKHVGTSYRYGGKSPTGFDCSGFVYYVLKNFEVDLPGSSATQEGYGRKIRAAEARPGDLAFFRKSKTGRVYHVAMVYDNDDGDLTLIHSTSSRGVVIDRVSESSYWRTKFITLRNVISD